MDKEKLKACPFCGCNAIKQNQGGERVKIGCLTFECPGCLYFIRAYTSEKEAVKAWNRRADNVEVPDAS